MSNQRSQPILVTCPACASQVSNQAAICPRCGQPIATSNAYSSHFQSSQQTLHQPQNQSSVLDEKDRKGLMLAICVLVVFALGIIIAFNGNNDTGSNVNTGTSPPPTNKQTDLSNPEIEGRISRGAKIYQRVETKYRYPVMFTWQGESISLSIPVKEWNSLTKEDQVNLSYYAEKLVSTVRANPAPYIDKYQRYMNPSRDGYSVYDPTIQTASNLCPTCWKLVLGKPVYEKGKFDFIENETVVNGATADAFRQQPDKKLAVFEEFDE